MLQKNGYKNHHIWYVNGYNRVPYTVTIPTLFSIFLHYEWNTNKTKYILKWQESFGHRKCATVVCNYGNLGRVNENLQGPTFQIYLEVWWVCEPNTCYDYLISNRDGSRSCMLRLTGLSMTVIVFLLRGIVFGGQMATFVFSKNTF